MKEKIDMFFYREGIKDGYNGNTPTNENKLYLKGYRKGIKIYLKKLKEQK